ncbi:signal peptidase I [Haladaptatus sp. DYF46]|uniref:signal peptidase I n=1 Tax=Haladaptatus sp. DYF46 TaxID=2886041 RepID=UPI001E487C92|nr:signal peptidase I [Haladaptatus sp. DYF46]
MRAFATARKPRRIARIGGGVVLAFALVLTTVVVFPQMVGASGSYVVLSGSMSPTIHAGDVVISRTVETADIEAGDVIVFHDGVVPSDRTTHRVVNVVHRDDGVFFETKGDANEDPDPNPVPADDVIGRVWFHVPYIGHLILFARSRMGLLSLVIVPCLLLVVTEAYSLVSAALGGDSDGTSEGKSEPTEPNASTSDDTEPVEKIG